ncbi:immunoglobulin kappa light chain-like isoform X3 [Heptranchias perlo]|uniref:immunoglobulin kappa light chain-like isoform X3 n=1 Tax=Heptranchias perlo TaxID=212740 RepID=UPI0035597274
MSLHYWVIVLTVLPCGCFAQTLTQLYPSVTSLAGKTGRFLCEVKGASIDSSNPIHWYQHKPGQPPTRILYYNGKTTSRDPGFDNRFKAGTSKGTEFYLAIDKVKAEEAATYYCARWVGVKQFGTGTKLIVTEEEAKKPRIRLFPPNGQELKETSEATVVCLLTGFFPEVIKVYWEIAGHRQEDEKVGTDSVEKEEGETYSVISRLKISKLQWEEDKITCGAEHETAPEATTIDKNSKTAPETAGPTCPPSETVSSELSEETDEGPPLSSLQVASFTYTLLLMKNVVYCGIISFILYRAEYHHPKKPL